MSAALQGDSQEIVVMTRLYDAAVRQLVLKFEILNDEFKVLYARNPIHHIEGRVKSLPSIAAKLLKKGQPLTIEAAKRNVDSSLGSAMLAGVAVGVFANHADAVERCVREQGVTLPDPEGVDFYNEHFKLYKEIQAALAPIYHKL